MNTNQGLYMYIILSRKPHDWQQIIMNDIITSTKHISYTVEVPAR